MNDVRIANTQNGVALIGAGDLLIGSADGSYFDGDIYEVLIFNADIPNDQL